MRKTDFFFVIDTNTLVSAFILPDSIARRALNKARQLGKVVISKSTASEFTDVFIRPKFDKYLGLDVRIAIINEFISLAYFTDVEIKITASRDKKDDQFLELAATVEAKCIITGDKDLIVLHPFNGIPIISPSEFLKLEFTQPTHE